MDIADQLRRHIRRSPLSRYRICKEAEVDQGNLSNFMSGTRGLSLDTLSRLCGVLGLKLVYSRHG